MDASDYIQMKKNKTMTENKINDLMTSVKKIQKNLQELRLNIESEKKARQSQYKEILILVRKLENAYANGLSEYNLTGDSQNESVLDIDNSNVSTIIFDSLEEL